MGRLGERGLRSGTRKAIFYARLLQSAARTRDVICVPWPRVYVYKWVENPRRRALYIITIHVTSATVKTMTPGTRYVYNGECDFFFVVSTPVKKFVFFFVRSILSGLGRCVFVVAFQKSGRIDY